MFRRQYCCHLVDWLFLVTLLLGWFIPLQASPHLGQQHFRVTVIVDDSFLTLNNNSDSGIPPYGGYLVNMMTAIAERANFTVDFVPPSGFGKDCSPQLNATMLDADDNSTTDATPPDAGYGNQYFLQYNCGSDDVTELHGTPYGTDMYLGMYYLTPDRQEQARHTVPFQPPRRGTLSFFGTATRIASLEDLIQQQQQGIQPAVCVLPSTATWKFLEVNVPTLRIQPFVRTSFHEAMDSGECPIFIGAHPNVAEYIRRLSLQNRCSANNQPIGIISNLDFGLSHYAIGVGHHLPVEVVDALSYWINTFMIDGTLAGLYHGGTGDECGYVAFPVEQPDDALLSGAGIAGVVVAAFVGAAIPLYAWYAVKLKRQQRRYKKRFVRQIARNIAIGPTPGSIPPDKLTEQILHIGQGKEFISKEDLSKWMLDVKMDFISERDFDALWSAIDIDDSGQVNAVDFIVFLSACGPEFEKVYEEQENMPKVERLKLAARRLSNLALFGETGVRQIERRLEGRTRAVSAVDQVSGSFQSSTRGEESLSDNPLG